MPPARGRGSRGSGGPRISSALCSQYQGLGQREMVRISLSMVRRASHAPARDERRARAGPAAPACAGVDASRRSAVRAVWHRPRKKPTHSFGIAFALRSSRFSASSSRIRWASSLVIPGLVPASISAFLTQVRSASGRGAHLLGDPADRPLDLSGSRRAPAPPSWWPALATPRDTSTGSTHNNDPSVRSPPPLNPGRFIELPRSQLAVNRRC